ncbi:MAG: hypothetical protein ABI851_01950 [Saprospiraceae bacterium]
MKVKIIICILLLSVKANSQINLSVKFGKNYSKVDARQYYLGQPRSNYHNEQQYYKFAYFHNGGLDLIYNFPKWSIGTGIALSNIGASDYAYRLIGEGYLRYSYLYLQVPFIISHSLLIDNLNFGLGLNYSYRLFTNTHIQGDENSKYSYDLKSQLQYSMSKRWKLEFSFTFVNFQQYIERIKDKYIFYSFGLDVGFVLFKK